MSTVKLWSDFQNVPIVLKFHMNNTDNILNRFNLLTRSFELKGQLGIIFSKCPNGEKNENLCQNFLIAREPKTSGRSYTFA